MDQCQESGEMDLLFIWSPVSHIFRHLQAHSCSGNTRIWTKPARRREGRGRPCRYFKYNSSTTFWRLFFVLFRGHFLQMWFTMIKYIGLYYCSNLVTALPISKLHICMTVVPLVGGIYSWPQWHQVWPCDLLWLIQRGQRCMPVLSNSFKRPVHDFLSLPSPNNSKSQIGAIPSDGSPDWSDTIRATDDLCWHGTTEKYWVFNLWVCANSG